MNDVTLLRKQFREHLHSVLRAMTQAMTGMPAGAQRLFVSVEAYWEACFRQREERTQMCQAAQRFHCEADLMRMSQIFERMLASELIVCGVAQPHQLARGLGTEIRAIARAELFAGHRLPSQRRRLLGFLQTHLELRGSSADTAIAA
ncbi:MAG: hypothetical protein ACLGI7_11525 [Gammaproteobacteria bacterium]